MCQASKLTFLVVCKFHKVTLEMPLELVWKSWNLNIPPTLWFWAAVQHQHSCSSTGAMYGVKFTYNVRSSPLSRKSRSVPEGLFHISAKHYFFCLVLHALVSSCYDVYNSPSCNGWLYWQTSSSPLCFFNLCVIYRDSQHALLVTVTGCNFPYYPAWNQFNCWKTCLLIIWCSQVNPMYNSRNKKTKKQSIVEFFTDRHVNHETVL